MNFNESYGAHRSRCPRPCNQSRSDNVEPSSCRPTQNHQGVCEENQERALRNAGCACRRVNNQPENGCGANNSSCHSRSNCCAHTRENALSLRMAADCTSTEVPEGCVDEYPLAMAYVPMQKWNDLYDPASGLSHGTVFRSLDLPWYPTNCRKDCSRDR